MQLHSPNWQAYCQNMLLIKLKIKRVPLWIRHVPLQISSSLSPSVQCKPLKSSLGCFGPSFFSLNNLKLPSHIYYLLFYRIFYFDFDSTLIPKIPIQSFSRENLRKKFKFDHYACCFFSQILKNSRNNR